jgi:hypothetical protein
MKSTQKAEGELTNNALFLLLFVFFVFFVFFVSFVVQSFLLSEYQ